MADDEVLDEAYERLHRTGPEFEGWLSNHGPMASDALVRLGRPDLVHRWLDGYERRLHPLPAPQWHLAEDEWHDVLGDASRLGDWLHLFSRLLSEEPWEQVLVRWWPRLLPGAAASAAHGLIRTGHVVRALRAGETAARRAELGQALGYWAARWQPLPGHRPPSGRVPVEQALRSVPALGAQGGFRSRLSHLRQTPAWSPALQALQPVRTTAQVPDALTDLVDAAVNQYPRWAAAAPVMLVHAATAPRAVSLVLPSLPQHLWTASYEAAWAVAAAVSAIYRPPHGDLEPSQGQALDLHDLVEQVLGLADEHGIKFAEVVQESHERGTACALPALAAAGRLIEAD